MMDRSIPFVYKGNTFYIPLPNSGQLIDIEVRKSALSKGEYQHLASSTAYATSLSADLIDVLAYLTILSPEFIKSFKVNVLEIDLIDAAELVREFNKQFRPKYNDFLRLIKGEVEDDVKKEEATSSSNEVG